MAGMGCISGPPALFPVEGASERSRGQEEREVRVLTSLVPSCSALYSLCPLLKAPYPFGCASPTTLPSGFLRSDLKIQGWHQVPLLHHFLSVCFNLSRMFVTSSFVKHSLIIAFDFAICFLGLGIS